MLTIGIICLFALVTCNEDGIEYKHYTPRESGSGSVSVDYDSGSGSVSVDYDSGGGSDYDSGGVSDYDSGSGSDYDSGSGGHYDSGSGSVSVDYDSGSGSGIPIKNNKGVGWLPGAILGGILGGLFVFAGLAVLGLRFCALNKKEKEKDDKDFEYDYYGIIQSRYNSSYV
jgi:hypothetical protein